MIKSSHIVKENDNHKILGGLKVSLKTTEDRVIDVNCPAADDLEEYGCVPDSVTFMSTRTADNISNRKCHLIVMKTCLILIANR